jgi:hypothetical protein
MAELETVQELEANLNLQYSQVIFSTTRTVLESYK